MSSNFLVFNPSSINQETDALYAVDPLRTGGAQPGSILPSQTANKIWFQASTFVSAFAQMMVNKGYTVLDSNFANLVAVLTNVKTTADFEGSIVTVPFANSIVFNAALATAFDLTLTGNVLVSSLTNTNPGQIICFLVSQDATGGRTFVWPSSITTYPICPQPNSLTVQAFIVRTTGAIIPYTPMIWYTASGQVLLQPMGNVVSINASGLVSNQYAELNEKVNASSGPISRNLPTAIGNLGMLINIKKVDTTGNIISVQSVVAGQTVDGFPNFQITNPNQSMAFRSDNANWLIE